VSQLDHGRVDVGEGHLRDPMGATGQLHDAPVGEPFVDDQVGDLLERRGDVERGSEDAADAAQECQAGLRPGGGVSGGGAGGLGGLPRLLRHSLSGDVGRDADHARHRAVDVHDAAAGPADPPDAAAREQHAVLDIVVLSGLDRRLRAGEHRRHVVRVQQRQVGVQGPAEGSRLELVQALERLVTVDGAGGKVPGPRAHPAGLESQAVALDRGRRHRRPDALLHAAPTPSSSGSSEPTRTTLSPW
jgi:hypothetical protein